MPVKRVLIGDAIDQFAEFMESHDFAESTRTMYLNKLRRFREVYERYQRERRHMAYVSSIDSIAVSKFFNTYKAGWSRNDALRPLRRFLGWAAKLGYIEEADVVAAMDRSYARVVRKPKHFIEAKDFPLALEIAGEYHPRDRIAVALGIFTLCRVGEIKSLRLRDIDLVKGKAMVWRQKTRRYTPVVISIDLREELDAWLAWYADATGYRSPAAMMRQHPDWYLVPSVSHKHREQGAGGRFVKRGGMPLVPHPDMQAGQLEEVIKRVLDGLGVEGEQGFKRANLGEGMHTLRRSGARALLLHLAQAHGHDRALLQVSAMLDHENIKTTLLYIGMDREKAELDEYLSQNRMYGDLRPANQNATVVPLRAAETAKSPDPVAGRGAEAQSL